MPQQEPSAWLALEVLERAASRYMEGRWDDSAMAESLKVAIEVAQEAIKARKAWI